MTESTLGVRDRTRWRESMSLGSMTENLRLEGEQGWKGNFESD